MRRGKAKKKAAAKKSVVRRKPKAKKKARRAKRAKKVNITARAKMAGVLVIQGTRMAIVKRLTQEVQAAVDAHQVTAIVLKGPGVVMPGGGISKIAERRFDEFFQSDTLAGTDGVGANSAMNPQAITHTTITEEKKVTDTTVTPIGAQAEEDDVPRAGAPIENTPPPPEELPRAAAPGEITH